ncbi:uncharacterized protein LOC112212864 isoform X1 [Bombus impatiens]|uniref:Uncharacterized protein LOC112212864 isoform X1 n=1 Tax=Bombus impatiens TaxID=132113 RepID=A0A6P8LPB3_BOMIM|nr:uncharacterized protein LOC112212864 isoform X1 [Bombus impatiens]
MMFSVFRTNKREQSSQEASWRTPVDQIVEDSYDEYCSPACATPATPRTPISARREFRTPAAPLRVLSQRRDLRQGVAVASRRLNYDIIATGDDTFDSLDTDDSTGSSRKLFSLFNYPCRFVKRVFHYLEIMTSNRILTLISAPRTNYTRHVSMCSFVYFSNSSNSPNSYGETSTNILSTPYQTITTRKTISTQNS